MCQERVRSLIGKTGNFETFKKPQNMGPPFNWPETEARESKPPIPCRTRQLAQQIQAF